jgi:hypothetical protein
MSPSQVGQDEVAAPLRLSFFLNLSQNYTLLSAAPSPVRTSTCSARTRRDLYVGLGLACLVLGAWRLARAEVFRKEHSGQTTRTGGKSRSACTRRDMHFGLGKCGSKLSCKISL